jgi:hypothetical protein
MNSKFQLCSPPHPSFLWSWCNPFAEGMAASHFHDPNYSEAPFLEKINGQSDSGIGLAHWFLMLLFLLVWSAWLFWHWKREQKKKLA